MRTKIGIYITSHLIYADKIHNFFRRWKSLPITNLSASGQVKSMAHYYNDRQAKFNEKQVLFTNWWKVVLLFFFLEVLYCGETKKIMKLLLSLFHGSFTLLSSSFFYRAFFSCLHTHTHNNFIWWVFEVLNNTP